MKYLIILSLLMTVSSRAQESQQQIEDTPQKRPSWSQGLPERQSAIKRTAPVNKFRGNKQAREVEHDRSLGVAELPNVEIELASAQPIIKFEIESMQPAVTSRQEAFDQYYSNDKEGGVDTEVNPLLAQYTWKPIKTTAIDVPEDFDDQKPLKLNIRINPKGEVTRVTEVDTAIPKRVFKSAEKSILKWKFQAPAEIGITENISKTFSIDIKTDA